jgi:RNA processing factor Prp31
MELYEKHYDRVYFNGELILKRQNTYEVEEGSRTFHCDSPLQLVLALVKVIDDMDHQINMLESRHGHE